MVRYWCNACSTEHDNARDCPAHVDMRENARIGKQIKKTADDFTRRRKMKQNDYASKTNAPKKGCVVVALALVSAPTALVVAAIDYFS